MNSTDRLRSIDASTEDVAAGPRPRGGLAAWQMQRLLEYIETRLAERIQSGDLARRINVSVGRLFRAFRVSTGVSPGDYVTARRMNLACTMMKTTTVPLPQIAIACGLCDQSHLCRVFRRAFGTTPAVWRRENMVEPQRDQLPARVVEFGHRGLSG
jgi:AraC family transcriptional regulator